MSLDLLFGAIKAGFDFGSKVIDFLMTEDGKAWLKQTRVDRAAWDTFWKETGDGLKGFFKGLGG